MADQTVNYQCPACDGTLRFDAASGMLKCDYCDSTYPVAEMEERYREKEERAAKAKAEQDASEWSTENLTQDWGADGEGMKSYTCPSCAAELICQESTAATCCPYCGNQTVIPGQFSGALKPEFIIPFKKDKAAAIAALKNHYQGKKLLPKSFISGNHIEDIQGVYVPFWMFDATGDGDMLFHATTSETTKTEDMEIVTTKHYEVRRKGTVEFEKVPADASKRMPDTHMDSIEPYDYKELKPFSSAYMPGYLADKYDVETEEVAGRIETRCNETLENLLSESVTGYDEKSVKERNLVIKKGDVHYALLPVWLLATKWNDQNFLFAMNGQTGKLVGDLPMDKKKYWSYFGGWSAGLMVAMLLLNFFVLAKPATGFAFVLLDFLIPLFVGFLVASSLKAQLYSVHCQQARGYVAKQGVEFEIKTDDYVQTTVKKTPIKKNE